MSPIRVRVALVQRLVPHYNLTFYKKLLTTSQHSWEFVYGAHPEGGESGLATDAACILPTRRIVNHQIGPAIWQLGAGRWIREQRYDVVIFELGWQIISNPWLIFNAHRVGSVVIPWSKGIAESGRPRPAWRRYLERTFIHRCDALLAYGQVSANYFAAYGYPRDRIFVAQNSVDVRSIAAGVAEDRLRAKALRTRLGMGPGLTIGYFGRLVPQKRVAEIIEAYMIVRRDGMCASLVIAGDGPERVRLEEQARSCPYARDIVFAGRVPEVEAGAFFQLFDVFISAFSAGLGVLEAMAHGKVVVTTPEARPETEFIVDAQTGVIAGGYAVPDIAVGLKRAAQAVLDGSDWGGAGQRAVLTGATQEGMLEKFDLAVCSALARKKL